MNKSVLFLLFFMSCMLCFSQITNEGQPLSWSMSSNKNIEAVIMPSFDLQKLRKEDEINDQDKSKPYRFGYEFKVDFDLNNSGDWEVIPGLGKIWRINIVSSGAKTMNFVFDKYKLPEGAEIFIYNNRKDHKLGAYTAKMNNENNSLGTWIIDGDNIWIEYFVPDTAKDNGELQIGKVVHGYRSITEAEARQKALNDSDICNLDVNCDIGDDFAELKEELKKSVVLILNGGNDWCTGTLINNTNNDKAPYVLTANHCQGGEANWSFRFNWISVNTVCASIENSIDNGPEEYYQTTSGATVLAQNDKTDVELIEIIGGLDPDWDLEWAGWDRTGDIPDFTVGIHHPQGDIMKVCRDNNPPSIRDIPFNGNPETEIWNIDEEGNLGGWEFGVTQRGSSGSALFSPEGLIIGQLAGGGAACSGTNDNGLEDWYGRFDVSWDFGTTNSTRLSNWLDPANTGQTKLLGINQTLSIDENELSNTTYAMFPNPSNGMVEISSNAKNLKEVQVFNIFGQLVFATAIPSDNFQMNLNQFADGVYLVRFLNQSNQVLGTQKLILSK